MAAKYFKDCLVPEEANSMRLLSIYGVEKAWWIDLTSWLKYPQDRTVKANAKREGQLTNGNSEVRKWSH